MAFGNGVTLTNSGLAIITNSLIGSGDVPKYVGVGTGAISADRTAAATDTELSTEVGSRSGNNDPVANTTVVTDDTFYLVQEWTSTADNTALNEMGLFDASSNGNMFLSSTFGALTLNDTDSVEFTIIVQFEDNS